MDELKNSEYRIIRQSNRGLGAARNTGIRNAKGEFILPLDSDNYLRKSYLKSGVEILRNQSAVGVVYGDAEYFENKTGRWIIPEFDFLRLAMGNFIDACALFRRQIWEEIGGYDEKMPHMGWEDWDFWLRTISYGWQFKHLDEIAFDYRVRACSMLQETNRHQSELTSYIFNKPENRILRLIRNQQIEIERLKVIEESKDYRLGRTLIQPARTIKTLFGKTGTISG
jgi:glycosyltransferase involved in cell wall biosynthesis